MKQFELQAVDASPAVLAAVKNVHDQKDGTVSRTIFSAHDTGDLIGLQGASYIVRLAHTPPVGCRVYFGQQWYVDGKAGQIHYEPDYIPDWCEPSRFWLLDFAAFCNGELMSLPKGVCIASYRVKSLETGWQIRQSGIRIAPPVEHEESERTTFVLFTSTDESRKVDYDEDLPIAIWHRVYVPYTARTNIVLDIAASSILACVFYVRFESVVGH